MKFKLATKHLGSLTLLSTSLMVSAQENQQPNIVLILADDMGYSDIGCYGSEIETPNLDNLASKGIRYSHFYNGARSCPTRAALMTGLFAQQAGIGWMTNAHEGDSGDSYEGDLSKNALTIAEYLKGGGYKTYISGKWHLTSYRKINHKVKDNWPLQRGFDQFYGIVDGAANYFSTPVNIGNEDGVKQTDPNFYFTDAISDKTVEFIENNGDDPFFMYVAYNAPHWPLHAKPADIAKYSGKYSVGWDKLREDRFAKQKQIGLFDDTYNLSTRDAGVAAWEEVPNLDKGTGDKNKFELWEKRMEIYAAQIDAMDQGIGRIVKALKDAGKLDNTIIFFLSDNGPSAEPIGSDDISNMSGAENKFESYRRPWANLSSTPFREYKHHAHEGGINTPLIVHWPQGIQNGNGRFVRTTGHITDIFRTIEDVTKIDYPDTYNGHTIKPLQGESLLPDFKNEAKVRGPMFWEHEGNLAVRMGDWKLVVKTLENQPLGKLELYNMKNDPVELNDLANVETEKLNELWNAWYAWAIDKKVFPLRYADYDSRQSEDKRYPNGTFDYKTAGWIFEGGGNNGYGVWTIDDTWQITGQNSSKIEVKRTGDIPARLILKWANLQLKQGERCKIRFKAKADKAITMKLRLEKDGGDWAKVIDTDVVIGTDIKQYEYNSISVPGDIKHVIGFYFGTCPPCNVWIDDVEISFINNVRLSPEWTLNLLENGDSYNISFKGSTGFTGIDNFPVPVKVSLKTKDDIQNVYYSETVYLTKDKEIYNIDIPNPVKRENVFVEFEYPPYAATKCLIENPQLNTKEISSTGLLKQDDKYSVEVVGNGILVKQKKNEKPFEVEIYNLSGKILEKYHISNNQLLVPVIETGVYMVKIMEESEITRAQKILVSVL